MENKTYIYKKLKKDKIKYLDLLIISPTFFSYLIKDRQVIGIFIKKLKGRIVYIKDILIYKTIVRRLYTLGIIYKDLNRYNFIIDK